MIGYLTQTKQQRHVKGVIKKLLKRFPPHGKKHTSFLYKLLEERLISSEMAVVLTHIIENPDIKYKIFSNGTLSINKKRESEDSL
jgi:hypothetical protein